MTKQKRKITIAILSAIMAMSVIFVGAIMQTKSTAYATDAVTPSATYKIEQTGDISVDKWGGIALMSTNKTAIKDGDTFYIGYTVDSGTHTMPSSVLQGVLVTSNLSNRVHVDLTTAGGKGIHRGTFFSESGKDFLKAGSSYLITINVAEDETTAGKMLITSTVTITTSTGSSSYGMWEQRGTITEASSKEYSIGMWLSMAPYTCEGLVLSNFYIIDANGNDLGAKSVVESGNTINLSVKAEKCSATFKKADGTVLDEFKQIAQVGAKITLPQSVSDGFVCWKDSEGRMYNAGAEVALNETLGFTEVCSVVANKTYAVSQSGDVVITKFGGFNLMNANKNTFSVGETVYMGYTVEDVLVDFTSVTSPTHGLIFTNYAGSRTHTDLTIANWYSADAPDGKAGVQPYSAYSHNTNLLEKGATYRISFTLVEKGSAYAIETQVIKINKDGVTSIKLTDWRRYFNTINKDAGLDYYFGIFLTISGETPLVYENIALTNVFIADETGADLGVTARSDVNESMNLAIGEQSETINVTYKDVNGEVIAEYSGEKDFGMITVEDGVSENFVCWKVGNATYKPGDTILSLTDIELQEVCVDIAMIDGANIRMSNPTGLRFSTLMDKGVYDALINAFGAENVVTGTLILPTDYLTAGVEFTIDALTAKSIKHKNVINDGANSIEIVSGVEYYVYHASLVNILAQNLTRDFSARAYVQVKLSDSESVIVYSDYSVENNSRSVYEVACGKYEMKEFLDEINTPILESFINAVVTVTGDENGYTITIPSDYEESPYNVSNDANVITITAKENYDITAVKAVRVNGVNYVDFSVKDGKIVITVA